MVLFMHCYLVNTVIPTLHEFYGAVMVTSYRHVQKETLGLVYVPINKSFYNSSLMFFPDILILMLHFYSLYEHNLLSLPGLFLKGPYLLNLYYFNLTI